MDYDEDFTYDTYLDSMSELAESYEEQIDEMIKENPMSRTEALKEILEEAQEHEFQIRDYEKSQGYPC